MAELARVRVQWVGSAVVGESVSTFHCNVLSASTLTVALATYFNAVKALIPDRVSVLIPAGGEAIDTETGHLSGAWSGGTVATIAGTSGANYTLGVGVRQQWLTAGIAGTKRVKGATFIVPVGGNVWALDGHMTPTAVTTFNSASAALLATMGANFVVWSRPAPARPDAVPPRPARLGSAHPVTSAQISNLPSWLITRRT